MDRLTRLQNVPSWFFRALVLGAVLATILLAMCTSKVFAAPRALSGQECASVAGMGLIAAAMAAEPGLSSVRIERAMLRMYGGDERQSRILSLVVMVAYRDRPDPEAFAKKLLEHCLRSSGDLDGILGADS